MDSILGHLFRRVRIALSGYRSSVEHANSSVIHSSLVWDPQLDTRYTSSLLYRKIQRAVLIKILFFHSFKVHRLSHKDFGGSRVSFTDVQGHAAPHTPE